MIEQEQVYVVETSTTEASDSSSLWIWVLLFVLLAVCLVPLVAGYPTYRVRLVEDIVECDDEPPCRRPRACKCSRCCHRRFYSETDVITV